MILTASTRALPCAVEPALPLRTRIEDPATCPGWDSLVAAHPDATFFHTASWARTIAAAYGFQCCYVTVSDGERLLGVLPLIDARSWLRGSRGVSLPCTDECSPLVSEDVSAPALFDFALAEGKRRGWKYLELRGGHHLLAGLPESVSYYGHVLPLNGSLNDIFQNCDSAVRRAVRKAERAGVSVRFSTDLEAVREYYRLHCLTRSKHGAPPQPFAFFAALHRHVLEPGNGFVALASHGARTIAGAVFCRFGRKALYKFSASDDQAQELRGSNLVIWRSLQKLVSEGAEELNFGRTSLSNEGLRRFKRGWGGQERNLRYARYSFVRQDFVACADLASGFQRRLFSLLPLFLSRWIGRALYAHMT